MVYQNIDEVMRDTNELLSLSKKHELSTPIMFEIANPMARFSCIENNRESVAMSAMESLYLLSGMNGSDFLGEFLNIREPKKNYRYEFSYGPQLRFNGQTSDVILDYYNSNAFRRSGRGYTDQLAIAIDAFKENKSTQGVIMQFASTVKPLAVHSVWFYNKNGKLEMLLSAGGTDNYYILPNKILAPFMFIHQLISELVDIPLGSSRFVIGSLYNSKIQQDQKKHNFPIINMHNFQYPKGGMTLRDIDTLMSIMVEFVSRLDENSLGRANPFENDNRVQLWSDYAEVFRAWKAEKLGYKIQMEQNFFHPQLRFIFKGEAV